MNQYKLYYYRKFKLKFKSEKYLDIVTNERHRKEMSRVTLCSHLLEIESRRFAGIDRNLRVCKICSRNVNFCYAAHSTEIFVKNIVSIIHFQVLTYLLDYCLKNRNNAA